MAIETPTPTEQDDKAMPWDDFVQHKTSQDDDSVLIHDHSGGGYNSPYIYEDFNGQRKMVSVLSA